MSDIHEGVTLGEGGTSKEPVVERALEHLVDIVNRLIRREIATAAALETAGERLDDGALARLAIELEASHRERIDSLSTLVTDLGGDPAESSNLRSLLDRARVRLRELRGDAGILEALSAIETELASEYRGELGAVGFTDDERQVLAIGLFAADRADRKLRAAAPQAPAVH